MGHGHGREGRDRKRPDQVRLAFEHCCPRLAQPEVLCQRLTAPISVVEMLLNQGERLGTKISRAQQIHGGCRLGGKGGASGPSRTTAVCSLGTDV